LSRDAIVNIIRASAFITAYARGRHLDAVTQRAEISRIAARKLRDLLSFVAKRSPFYARYASAPLHEWPVMTKALWMGEFDRINTVGARFDELNTMALRAETTRNFSPTWRGHTVGLSSGTSGQRGLFLVSARERTQWAATVIAKMLPDGLLSRERVAFIFRAGGPLYESVAALGVRFRFFDQANPWDELVTRVCEFRPSIVVAQPQVLRLLIEAPDSLNPRRVISVAEVLDELDRARLERRFGVRVEQIYQATEGLLGATCPSGVIHLNEPYLIVEPEWQDAERSRFVPVITDLWRRAQPVIRYRLNDILRIQKTPCRCGRAALGIAAVEGRCDDLLWLRGLHGASVPLFSDLLTRVIVRCVPVLQEYEIVETARGHWRVGLHPLPAEDVRRRLEAQMRSLTLSLGAEPPELQIDSHISPTSLVKRRRVRGLGAAACAS
jgi:putative adenylate-forming enzyme